MASAAEIGDDAPMLRPSPLGSSLVSGPRRPGLRSRCAGQLRVVGLATLAALTLPACGNQHRARPGAATTALPIPEGPGCPAAADVMVAVFHEASEGRPAGWSLPLANREGGQGPARFQVLDAAAASAAGIPAPPEKLWLLQPGSPPCEATPGPAFADTVTDGPVNDVLGVQLVTSCPAPGKDQAQLAVALAAAAAPSGCVAILPRPVAGRVGEASRTTWQVMARSTPMPAAVEAALPKKDCAAPCEKLWTVDQVDFAGKPVAWDVAIEWLRVDRSQKDPCQWATEGDGGVLVAAADGSAQRVTTEHGVEPLHLAAVLADRAGPKVMVLEHIGEYATLDLGGSAPTPARHLRWYMPNEELYAGDRKLGPYCGP
jgi:hypothetical protein